MAKPKKVRLTKFEMEIMNYLWQHGPSPIRDVQEHYPEKTRPAYTTVQTIVYRLETKGSVRRVKKIGNAHIFEATITPEAAYNRVFDDLLGFFGNTVQPLMSYLVESRKLTLNDLPALEAALKKAGATDHRPAKLPAAKKTRR